MVHDWPIRATEEPDKVAKKFGLSSTPIDHKLRGKAVAFYKFSKGSIKPPAVLTLLSGA